MNAPDRYERFVVPEGVKKYGFFFIFLCNFFFVTNRAIIYTSFEIFWLGFRMRGIRRSWMQLHLLLKERIIQSGTLFACKHIDFSVSFRRIWNTLLVKNWFFFWVIWLTGNYIGMIMFCLLGTSCLILSSTKFCSGLVSRVLSLFPHCFSLASIIVPKGVVFAGGT